MSKHLVCGKRFWSIRDLFMAFPFFLICLCFRNDSLLKCKVLIFKRYDYYIFLCLPKVCNHTKWRSSFPKERADTEIFGKLFNTLFWVLQTINLVWVLKQSLLLTAWPLATPFVSISACSAKKRIQNLLLIFPIETVKYHEFAQNAEIIRRSSWKACPSWWREALGIERREYTNPALKMVCSAGPILAASLHF